MSVTPLAAHSARSVSRMERLELAMSMVFGPTPSQKRRRPVEDPPDSMTGVAKSVF